MRLTQIVFGVFKKKGIRPQEFRFVDRTPGKVETGKHRIVPDLKPGHKLRMWSRLATEEENIMYISRPYLTEEEEKHVPKEIIQRGVKTFEKAPDFKQKPLRSAYYGEFLDCLNVTRNWENY